MGKKLYITDNQLIALRESMANCHADSCYAVNEAAPEVDEYEIGDEGNNPPVGGNFYHVSEGIDFDDHGMSMNDENVLKKYNLKDLILSKNGNYVTLNKIVAKEIGNGYGGRFMEDLTKIADKNGWILSLTPDTSYGASSVGRLKKFYKRYGFVPNKGRHSDFNTKESMIRKPITENINEATFDEWYGNSVLKDKNGQPIKMYHGTDAVFDAFSKEHIGRTGAYEGYGFNFTPFESRARNYNSTNVIEAYLKVQNPMTTKSNKISLNDLMRIIKTIDDGKPYTDTIVAAYECPRYNEKWDEAYYRRALPIVAKTIYNYNKESEYGDAGIYAEICLNGNGEVSKVIDTFEALGYDAAIFYDNNDRINTVVVFEPNQIKKTTNTTYNGDSELMGENYDLEVNASDIDLSSFKKKDNLVPSIWKNGVLDSRIRLKLLDIADDFWDFVNLTWVEPKGVILTGSICNFNWSQYSDIDLHLVVDFDEIDEKTEFVKAYLDAKKNEWNNEHGGLEIMGYNVELYVQNVDEMPESSGIYDLEENDWIRKPNHNDIKPIGLDKFSIKGKAARIMTIIDDMYDTLASTNDLHKIKEIGEDAKYLWDKVKEMRRKGLEKNGESSSGNICYKYMRRVGYLDKLWKLRTICYDKSNSINESTEKHEDMFSMAMKHFGTTNDIRECGYILPNGHMLDFSGRHTLNKGTDSSYLSAQRAIDHRDISDIGWTKDGNTKNFDISMEDFIRLGAIRTHVSKDYAAINLFNKPTKQQIQVLSRIVRYANGCVDVEIGDGNDSLSYGEFKNANPNLVISQINRYFDDGINLMGNMNESINKFKNTIKLLKEEWVSDGNAEHNPYKKRWDAERKALKDFICNFGKVMQSKENGKLYKVYFDQTLSQLIGYNYCICIQLDAVNMKPKSILYIRALDKFSPNIKQVQYDTRGRDNKIETNF